MDSGSRTGFSEHHAAPATSLRRYVKCYTLITPERDVDGALPWRILPEGSSHLLLHVYRNGRPAELAFVGPRSVYADIDRRGRKFSVGVKFRPAGAGAFLGLSPGELTDLSMDIAETWKEDGRELRDRLNECAGGRDLQRCWAAIEATLLRRLGGMDLNPLAEGAVRLIEGARGRVPIREVARDAGVSERRLREVVTRHVGLGPKRLARITRVTDTLRRAEQGRGSWASLAASGGYCDQSHMIEEFRALLGESPEAFVRRQNRE